MTHPNFGFAHAILFVPGVHVVGVGRLVRQGLGWCFDESRDVVSIQEEVVLLVVLHYCYWVTHEMTTLSTTIDHCCLEQPYPHYGSPRDLDFEFGPDGEIFRACVYYHYPLLSRACGAGDDDDDDDGGGGCHGSAVSRLDLPGPWRLLYCVISLFPDHVRSASM